jgi:hypothetical protein
MSQVAISIRNCKPNHLLTSAIVTFKSAALLFFCCNTLPNANANALAETLSSSPTVVFVKKTELQNNDLMIDEVDIITLALEKTKPSYGAYEIRTIPSMTRARTLSALSHNIYPNLIMRMSYEDELVAVNPFIYINIPVDFGANSYRICFARDELKPQLFNTHSIDQLRTYTFGAGIGWLDVKILRSNGMTVIEQANITNIIRMTKAGRVDLFCRGFNEIFSEIQNEPEMSGLSYDHSFALYYPLPKFLFAHSSNSAILKRIEEGLLLAIKDGTLKELWLRENEKNFLASHFNTRRIFRLTNPYIKNLPKNYDNYFYSMQDLEKLYKK